MKKIIFMGTPDYAALILSSMIESKTCEVIAVYTQPDKPVGRKALLTPPPVKVVAQSHNITVLQPNSLRDSTVIDELKKIKCDMIIVAAYGQILPKEVLEYVPCVNLHASILPQYRGASPIQQSLLNNDTKSGITAMLMDVGLDTGDIITIKELDIDSDEMLESLYNRLTSLACEVTLDVIKNWDMCNTTPQDNSKASLCKKIKKDDGLIDFSDARDIYNRYRAFMPWPGIFTADGLKLKEISIVDEEHIGDGGKIIKIEKDFILLECNRGILKVSRVQAPSKQEVNIIDYLRGKRLNLADYLA